MNYGIYDNGIVIYVKNDAIRKATTIGPSYWFPTKDELDRSTDWLVCDRWLSARRAKMGLQDRPLARRTTLRLPKDHRQPLVERRA